MKSAWSSDIVKAAFALQLQASPKMRLDSEEPTRTRLIA